MTQDLNTRIEQAASGNTPQTLPDERRRYLGSLRERVLIQMTNEQLNNQKLCTEFIDHIDDYKNYSILINGKISDNEFITKVMEICSQKDINFTLICDDTAQTHPDSSGILVVSSKAINQLRINIAQVYSKSFDQGLISSQKKDSKFKTFFKKLF